MRAGVAAAGLVLLLGCARTEPPALGEIMTLTQMRHAKLWLAGQAANWPLADYELDELQEGLDDVVKFHPTHKDAPLPLAEVLPKVMTKPMADLRAAVAAHDASAFTAAFDALSAGCNACHQATNFGFNVVRRPGEAAWFGNQDFRPPRS